MDPVSIAVTLILVAALFLVGQLIAPRPKDNSKQPANLGDFLFPTSTEGRFIPLVWGTVELRAPNVVWYGDYTIVPITRNVRVSIFVSAQTTVGFSYYVGFHAALCRGPIDSVQRIRWGDFIAWDSVTDGAPTGDPYPTISIVNKTTLFGGNDLGNGGVSGDIDVMLGADAQPVNLYLAQFQQALHGTNRTPAYNGTASLVFKSFYVGNSTQLLPLAVTVRRIPNGLGLDDSVASINSANDANPANVLYEVITNTEWGLGEPASSIDVTSFTAAAQQLALEGNGFSFTLDAAMQAEDLRKMIERQIGGICQENHSTGLWTITLLRQDYDPTLVLELSKAANIKEITSFVEGTWSDTHNQVLVPFANRDSNFNQSTAVAIDSANAQVQGNASPSTGLLKPIQIDYPGVKDADLANQLAWRDLRTLSTPRTLATFVCAPVAATLRPGDPFVFTDPGLRKTRYPMRVVRVKIDLLDIGTVTVDAENDVSGAFEAGGGRPPQSLWVDPSGPVQGFAHQFIIESPNGLNIRVPEYQPSSGQIDRFWTGAVRVNSEIGYIIYTVQYDLVGFPSVVNNDSKISALCMVGSLKADLAQGPVAGGTITVTMVSSTQQSVLLANVGGDFVISDEEIGTNLWRMIQIENEILLYQQIAAGSGNDVVLTGVFRAILDTVQPAKHSAGADVFFTNGVGSKSTGPYLGGAVSSGTPQPFARTDISLGGFNTENTAPYGFNKVSIVPVQRSRLPMSPGQVSVDTVADGQTCNLEFTGSGDSLGTAFSFIRRDYRFNDEVRALTVDASDPTIHPDFPAVNNTKYTVRAYADPLGARVLAATYGPQTSPSFTILRDDVIFANGGVVPATIGAEVDPQHDYQGSTLHGLFFLTWIETVQSELSSRFAFVAANNSGSLATGVVSVVYTATVTGTYAFTLFSALPGSVGTRKVQRSVNGGAYSDLIADAGTSGNIALNSGDSISIKHLSDASGFKRLLKMAAPGIGQSAYSLIYG